MLNGNEARCGKRLLYVVERCGYLSTCVQQATRGELGNLRAEFLIRVFPVRVFPELGAVVFSAMEISTDARLISRERMGFVSLERIGGLFTAPPA